jgi:predicted SprT family Zn-dependent metalloprotease
LQDAEVCWGDLTKDEATGMTYFFDDGAVRIEVDRRWVTSESKVREVLDHEACHVATEAAVKEQKSDPHGAIFQKCMQRLKRSCEGPWQLPADLAHMTAVDR